MTYNSLKFPDLNDLGLRNTSLDDPKAKTTLSKFSKVLKAMNYPEMESAIDQIRFNETLNYELPEFEWFDTEAFPDYRDVTLKFDNNQEISVHKCILVSRLEYFRMMFLHTWAEKNLISLHNIPIEYFRPIINFSYTNDPNVFKSEKYSETFMFNMISICDQFLINNVKNIFELLISAKIYIRNCGEILDFAFRYNCEILKNVCLKFICCNLSRVVESTSLDSLDCEILNETTKYYRNYFNLDAYRIITPDSEAISDEDLMEFIEGFEIDYSALGEDKTSSDSRRSKGKTKTTPNKIVTDKRNYEREARAVIKNLSLENREEAKESRPRKSECEDEQTKRENWKKVPGKKDDKNRMAITAAKINEMVRSESFTPPKENFVSLNKLLATPTSPTVQESDSNNNSMNEDSSYLRHSFTLADFTPTKMKTSKSKKQRRLSEQESNLVAKTPEKEEPKPPPIVENVWKIDNVKSAHLQPIDLSASKTPAKPLQKVKAIKKEKPTTSSSSSSTFSVILKDELKEKQHYEKSKTKSLILTQMEEQAIAEMRSFYNVSMIFDEDISIHRKNQYSNKFNFAIWQNQQQKEKTSTG